MVNLNWNGDTIVPVKGGGPNPPSALEVDLVKRAMAARHRMASLHPQATSDQIRWRMGAQTWYAFARLLSPADIQIEPDGTMKLFGIPVERVHEGLGYGRLEWAVQA